MKLKIFARIFQNLEIDDYQGIKAGNPHFFLYSADKLRIIRWRYVRHALRSCLNRAVWSIEALKMAADSMYTQGLYITGLMRYRCFVGKKISQELQFLGLLSQILSQKNGFLVYSLKFRTLHWWSVISSGHPGIQNTVDPRFVVKPEFLLSQSWNKWGNHIAMTLLIDSPCVVCKLCDESLDIRLYLKIFGIFLDCQKPWKIRQVTRFNKRRFIH